VATDGLLLVHVTLLPKDLPFIFVLFFVVTDIALLRSMVGLGLSFVIVPDFVVFLATVIIVIGFVSVIVEFPADVPELLPVSDETLPVVLPEEPLPDELLPEALPPDVWFVPEETFTFANTLLRLVIPLPMPLPPKTAMVLFFIIFSTASTSADPDRFVSESADFADRITAASPAATGHAMEVPDMRTYLAGCEAVGTAVDKIRSPGADRSTLLL
jgi:hypothetical protein